MSGDTTPRKKPDPLPLLYAAEKLGEKPENSLLVGDSSNDVTAARQAGFQVVCVPYGYNEGRPFESLACDRAVATLAEAAELLERARP